MSDKYFLDTNVLVYSIDLTSPLKRGRARNLVTDGTTSKLGVISYQVVQEFVNVALGKFRSVSERISRSSFAECSSR
jgi:predicted nucleic acid-binding protein